LTCGRGPVARHVRRVAREYDLQRLERAFERLIIHVLAVLVRLVCGVRLRHSVRHGARSRSSGCGRDRCAVCRAHLPYRGRLALTCVRGARTTLFTCDVRRRTLLVALSVSREPRLIEIIVVLDADTALRERSDVPA